MFPGVRIAIDGVVVPDFEDDEDLEEDDDDDDDEMVDVEDIVDIEVAVDVAVEVLLLLLVEVEESLTVVDIGRAEMEGWGEMRTIAVVLETVVVVATGTGMVVETCAPPTAHSRRPMDWMNFDSAARIAEGPSLSRNGYWMPDTETGADVTVAQIPGPPVESATRVSWNSVYSVKTLYAVGDVSVAPATTRRELVKGM